MTNHTRLMTSLVKLTNSKYGNIGPLWSLKKLNWITISVRKVQEPKGDEDKTRSKRIIADSIKYHLIFHVSSLKTPKGSVRCYDKAIEEE